MPQGGTAGAGAGVGFGVGRATFFFNATLGAGCASIKVCVLTIDASRSSAGSDMVHALLVDGGAVASSLYSRRCLSGYTGMECWDVSRCTTFAEEGFEGSTEDRLCEN